MCNGMIESRAEAEMLFRISKQLALLLAGSMGVTEFAPTGSGAVVMGYATRHAVLWYSLIACVPAKTGARTDLKGRAASLGSATEGCSPSSSTTASRVLCGYSRFA